MVRRLAASLLVVLVLCLISHASLWQSSVKQPGTPDSQKENPAAVHDNQRSWEDGGPEEVSALRYGSDALAAYDKKPDCFKKAAQALRQGCKSIDLDEDEKTKYAIRLTACEIATANMPMPVDCMDSGEARDSSSSYTNSKSHEIGRCVQSLGRVPQLWTSYSGYFREVKVMCLAVQYSLENDELRNLQRNLTRNHADQIALLRAQRQELLETHRVETAQLKEIQDLHSKMGAQVNAILTSASQMRDTLASILKDISIITQHTNQGVTEQELALDNMRQIKEELLSGFQVTLLQTVELVTRQSQSWHEMMSNGLLRFQELDRHAEEQLVKIVRANQGLESMTQQVGEVTNQLQDLKEQAVLGTQELLEQQDKGSEEFTQLTMKILHNMILALDTLDNHTQTSWQGMIETFKAESSDFQKEVADLLASTASDIGAMASESQEKLDQLNDAFYELKAKRWRFFWPIQMAIQFFGAEGILEPTALVSTTMTTLILIGHSFLYGKLETVVLVGTMLCVHIGLDQISISVSFLRLVIARLMLLMFTKAQSRKSTLSRDSHRRSRSRMRSTSIHRSTRSPRSRIPESYQGPSVEPLPLPRTHHRQPPASYAKVSLSKLSMIQEMPDTGEILL